jgi:hypothetical protein
VGSPGAPQPMASRNTKTETRKSKNEPLKRWMPCASEFRELRVSIFDFRILQNVAAQVLVLHDFRKLSIDVGGIYFNVFLFEIRCLKREFIQNFF